MPSTKSKKPFSSSAGAAAKAVAVSRLNAIAAESSRERNFFVLMKMLLLSQWQKIVAI